MWDKRFIHYLEKNFYNQIYYAISDYIERNRNNVRYTCSLQDLYFNKIWLGDDEDCKFYGLIKVDVIIKNKDDDYEDGHREPFFVKIHANLCDIKKSFKVIYVTEDYEEFKFKLKDNFLPYYEGNDYENVAKSFLERYYPESFSTSEFDVKTLLENMGLSLKTARLTSENCIFGLIAFEDIEIDTYNILGKPIKTKVKANTIIIDAICKMKLSFQDKDLFTIIHECVHYYIHRKFYYYKKLFNKQPVVSKCHIADEYSHDDDIKWLEIQANKIAARILMPLNKIKLSIDYFLKSHELVVAEDYVKMLDHLKSVYKVSYDALKMRLKDLQYNKLVGIKEYINGEYLRPYIFSEAIQNNESFSISRKDFIIMSFADKTLREILSQNSYLYVEGHVCLDTPKYINKDGNNFYLTDYALNHIDECCIKFKYQYAVTSLYEDPYSLTHCRVPSYINTSVSCTGFKVKEGIEEYIVQHQEYIKEMVDYKDNLPESFSETLKILIKDYAKIEAGKGTQMDASINANINYSTVQRWISKKTSPNPLQLLKFCIGLKIPKEISEELFRKAGIELSNNSLENIFIKQALTYMLGDDVYKLEEEYLRMLKK